MILSLTIFLPLLGSIFAGLFGKYLGQRGSVVISILNIFLCFLFSSFLFYNSVFYEYKYYLTLFPWIHSGLLTCNWGFLFDTLTVIMLVVVTSISTLVHIYSSEYMLYDPHRSRFMSYLSLFSFFMLILVTADNFVLMFVGWEGVGFCSYLLINFWFTRLQANKAAIKAMLINRVSDFALVLGLCAIFTTMKSLEYLSVFPTIVLIKDYYINFLGYDYPLIDVIGILLFIGAMGKSAQLFLHIWLPDAMEGPTPVSALIHAATMVTAGVFLVARCSPIIEYSSFTLNVITIIGAMTAFFASTVGLVQNDLKKVIAYSTCSQLGYMFFACGLSNYALGVFHLSNHAFFKALLFLSAGSVIHAMSDEQDMRKMGGLRRILPFTYVMFVIGSLSLMGFPFLTGFYSKDVILEVAYASYSTVGSFSYWLGTVAAFFTAFYSTRLIYLTFLNETNAYKAVIAHAHDAPFRMALPLGILAFGSIFIGYLSKDMFIGLGTSFWDNALFVHPNNIQMVDAEFLPSFIKNLPVIVSIGGSLIAFYLYHFNYKTFYSLKMTKYGIFVYNFLNRRWYFDKLYNEIIGQNLLHFGYHYTYKTIDKGLIEFLGPKSITEVLYSSSKEVSKLQTGYIFHYSAIFFLGLIFLLGISLMGGFTTLLVNVAAYSIFIILFLFFIGDNDL